MKVYEHLFEAKILLPIQQAANKIINHVLTLLSHMLHGIKQRSLDEAN